MRKFYLFISILLFTFSAYSQVKINEVYGGGGNAGSTWTNDFIELYNPTGSSVSLVGWSVQYASATGTTWQVTNLTGSIPANGYYLIQQAAGAGGTTPLPTPEVIGTIAMSGTAGKVLLCNVTTAQAGANPVNANIIDKVGFGVTANGFEGAGPTPAPSNTTSVERSAPGFDTDNNNTDFVVLNPPTPTNSGVDATPPVINTLSPVNTGTGVAPAFLATITFSEPVKKGTGNIVLKRNSDNSVVTTIDVLSASVTVAGSSASFLIQSLPFNTSFYFEISAGAIKDNANNDFAGITGNSTWTFTTTAKPVGTVGTTYNFNTCSGFINSGFTQHSVVGDMQLWGCTTFGRDPANPTLSLANGMQMNGFSGTNIPNEDWFISPSFDLTATTFPLLSFWSRTRFNGAALELKVSTDYPGFGNPNNFTWTNLNGMFPAQTSDIWTESKNINLAAFKASNVYFAFIYNSSIDDGARWTLDDILITDSPTPPPPSLSVSTADLQFGFVAAGGNITRPFSVTGNDITGDITLNASAGFTLADNAGGPFTSSLVLTQAASNNITRNLFARFSPGVNDQNFSGTITVSTPGVSNLSILLHGTSIDPANTLEVVNWNIEWFGSPTNGPTNDAQQQANVQTILQNIGADIYGLTEIVSEARLASVVANMPGYAYVISNFGSHTNTSVNPVSALADAQKLAYVYKTSLFTNVTTEALLSQGINAAADITNPAYNYFSSGRFPYMLTADLTLNGITQKVRFVLIHAKANTSPTITSYNRRKSGSDTLHQTLNALYPTDRIIFFGDFNDDLDSTITDGINPKITSYSSFTNDNVNFFAPTLSLSLSGKKSTVGFNDVIDHTMVSNEMKCFYMPNTANILTDVTTMVSNFGSTTSDHFPVFTRYSFSLAASASIKYNGSPYCNTAGMASVTRTGTAGGTYSSTAGLVINVSSGEINLGSSTPGIYIVTYTISGAGECDQFTATTSVTINALPSAPVSGGNQTVCAASPLQTLTATATVPAGQTVVWYTATTGGTLVTNPTLNSIGTITYHAAARNTATGCESTTRTAVTLTINPLPTATITAAGPTTFCVGSSVVLNANTGTGLSYQWKNGTTNVGTNSSSFTATTSGSYTVVVTITATGCTQTSAATVVNAVAKVANPVVSKSATGNTVTFSWPAIPGAIGYIVSLNGGSTWIQPTSGPTGLTHTIVINSVGQVAKIWVRALGSISCADSDWSPSPSHAIDAFVPNSFTPNGDGKNDRYIIPGEFSSFNLRILNNLGHEVYSTINSTVGWNGKFKGEDQPAGVYTYILKARLASGIEVNRTGIIYLIR